MVARISTWGEPVIFGLELMPFRVIPVVCPATRKLYAGIQNSIDPERAYPTIVIKHLGNWFLEQFPDPL